MAKLSRMTSFPLLLAVLVRVTLVITCALSFNVEGVVFDDWGNTDPTQCASGACFDYPVSNELGGEDSSLLQARVGKPHGFIQKDSTTDSDQLARALAGKSIYFVVVDRFARTDGNQTACANGANNNEWCGGKIRGITDKLDYIKGMGFDCVWITPVVKQYPGSTPSGTGCMGYWAEDLYEIDERFGTPQDLHDLVSGLHSRGMCIVLDFVANHMGPVHSAADVHAKKPFNQEQYYHQLFRGDLTFDEYTQKTSGWPPPAQAMWSLSGAQCTLGQSCNCYKCVQEPNLLGLPSSYGPCLGRMEYNPESPCPKDTFSAYCMPGDYTCKGYNETITHEGWFYDLGDLNQTEPFVREGLLRWIRWMVLTYKIDALRLDTAPFMPFDFLSELQAAAGVPIIGEVTAQNITFHAQFQANPPPRGEPVLAGVLNFPLYYAAQAAFCGTWQPFAQGNLSFLGFRMNQQRDSGVYRNLDVLGNFPDNHDVDRITFSCEADYSRVANAVAWSMLARGVPIIYYGTEQLLTWPREGFWTYGYKEDTRMYKLIQALNKVRKTEGIALETQDVKRGVLDPRKLVFSRGRDERVFVLLNNMQETNQDVLYCGALPRPPRIGFRWVDALTGEVPSLSPVGAKRELCLVVKGSQPKVLVQRPVWASEAQVARS